MYAVVFLLMFVWNILTPLYADDLYASHESLRDIINSGVRDYFMWNGRIIGQSMMRVLSSSNYIIASLLNAACFVVLMHLILKLGSGNNDHKLKSIKYIVIVAVSFIFIPAFGQTILWRAGSGNYLWTTTLNLLFIFLFTNKKFLVDNSNRKILSGVKLILFCLLAVVAGWSNENTSGGTILLLLLYLIYWKLAHRKIFFNRLLSLLFCSVGYLALLFSPGNRIRTRVTMGESYLNESLSKKLLDGIFNVSNSVLNMYLPLLLGVVLLIVLMYHYWFSNEKLIEGLIWAFSGVAIIYALCFSPIGQDGGRAFLEELFI